MEASKDGCDMQIGVNKLFEGYQLEVGESESSLLWQLSSGLMWRKKIWPRVTCPRSMHRWNAVEEILSYLISFESHKNWITTTVPTKPSSGTILFFDKTKTKNYRSDGHDWKTRKMNASVREDRMKLKVCGMQLLYGCYTHCASIPTLHRRSYWLIQDPDIIMVHYLEVDNDMTYTEVSPSDVSLVLQDEIEVRRCFPPANWASLTISDRNLCSILSRTNTASEIQTLSTQLRLALDQNLLKATNLGHAIAMNNSGLPFDWTKDAQPKKQPSRVAPKESANHEVAPGRLINLGGVASHSRMVVRSDQVDNNQILKALSSSHVIMCIPRNGSGNYVLLNANSAGSVKPEGEGGREEQAKLPVRTPGAEAGNIPPEILSKLEKPVQSPRETWKGSHGPKGKGRSDLGVPQDDYDPSQFSNFASRLVEGDPLQGFTGLEGAPQIGGGNFIQGSSSPHKVNINPPVIGSGLDNSSNFGQLQVPNSSTHASSLFLQQNFTTTNSASGETKEVVANLWDQQTPHASSLSEMRGERGGFHSEDNPSLHSHSLPPLIVQSSNGSPVLLSSLSPSAPPPLSLGNTVVPVSVNEHVQLRDTGAVFTLPITQQVRVAVPDVQSLHSSVTADDLEGTTDSEMLDLNLNLDQESISDLLKLPLSPETSTEGEDHTEGTDVTRMDDSVLSPLSELMQSQMPCDVGQGMVVGEGEAHGHTLFQGTSSTGQVPGASYEFAAVSSSNEWHPGLEEEAFFGVHGAQPNHNRATNEIPPTHDHCMSANAATSSSFSVCSPLGTFPHHSSPQSPNSYRWEELLHQPSNFSPTTSTSHSSPQSHTASSLTHSTLSHSHTAIPHSHTVSSGSHTPNPPSLSPRTHQPQQSPHHMTTQFYPNHDLDSLLGLTSDEGPFLDPQLICSSSGASPLHTAPVDAPLHDVTATSLGDGTHYHQIFEGPPGTIFPPPQGGQTFLSPTPSQPATIPSLNPRSFPHSPSESPLSSSILDGSNVPSQPLSRSISPRTLSDIPEGVPMNMLLDSLNQHLGGANNLMEPTAPCFPLQSYRTTKSPTPSSPSISSVSGHSTVSSLFDPAGESPSVLELCEMLGESPNVQQHDFSNMTFTDVEQKQLYKAIQIIQNAFRKFRTQWQQLPRVEDRQKHAALLIENYYTRYRQLKQQQDSAARRIQHSYRMYRSRSREMNRAALFIQQMYRFHRNRRQQPEVTSTLHHYIHEQ